MRGEHAPDIGASATGPETAPANAAVMAPAVVPLEAAAVLLPAALPAMTRADLTGLVIATLAHAAVILAFLSPDRRLGAGGSELEAIGIEIVTVAPALEARSGARGRDAAASARPVAERDGEALPTPAETPTMDSRREETQAVSERAPAPADIVVPDWTEPQRPPDPQAREPIVARAKATGTEVEASPPLRPTLSEQPMSVADSIPAAELPARAQGGAAARGHATIDVASAVMAAARAGRRSTYWAALLEAIRANAPQYIEGASGKVNVVFTVLQSGSVGTVRIDRSSGNPKLDEAVLAAIRSTRFPPPPAELTSDDLIYELPFTFQ